jgi:hypothetical protein
MGKVALACAGAALAVSVMVIAISGASSADKHTTVKASVAKANASTNLICTGASLSLGQQQGTVEIKLQCDGAGARGTNRVDIARFINSRPGLQSDFRAVSVEGEKGKCDLRRGIASCVVPRGKAVTMSGKLRVPPGSDCSRAVSAYVVLPSSCGGSSACNLEFATESLFRGRPRGCN